MLFGFGNLHAQITAIPDTTFEQWLINNNIDTDGLLNHQVATADISGITDLNLYYVDIRDFTGLQDFKALTSLTTGYAPATSMDLSALTELTSLSLYGNSLITIDLSHNLKLTNLNLGNSGNLRILDVSANIALTKLQVHGYKIATLDLSHNIALTEISLGSGLVNLNIANGNNHNVTNFWAANCDLLSCVKVDPGLDTSGEISDGEGGFYPIWQAYTDDEGNHITTFSETDCGVYTPITDPVFEQALIDQGIDINTTLDKKVLTSAVVDVETLNLENLIINDMTGISDFKALKELHSSNAEFYSIDLSQNTNLKELRINANYNLDNIDLSQNSNLEVLDISNNVLRKLDISKNPKITELFCNNNKLIALNLKNRANNPAFNIQSVFTGNLNLTCIEVDDVLFATNNWLNKDATANYYNAGCPTIAIPDPNFEQVLINNRYDDVLDGKVIAGNIADVEYLSVSYNNISDLKGIEGFVSLKTLEAYNNNLTSIDLSKNTLLINLNLGNNQLKSLDVSKNLALIDLNFSFNEVKTIDVIKNIALQYLFCENNKISKIDISKNPLITQLSAETNSLLNLNLKGNTNNIYYLRLSNNPLLGCIEVDDVNFANTGYHPQWQKDNSASYSATPCDAYTLIPDVAFEQSLIDEGIDSGIIDGKVLTSTLSAVTNLSISNTTISDFSGLEDFTELNWLQLSNNTNLTDIEFSKNTKLQYLYLDNNKLANLDVTKNVELIDLSFKNNAIKAIDVSKNAELEFLNCSENLLTVLDVSNNPELRNLSCYSNQLVTLDLSQNTQLTYINCQNNKLKSVNLKNGNNTNLQTANVAKTAKNNVGMYPIGIFGFQENDPALVVLVDNKVYSDDNWMSYKDASAVYLENISLGTGNNTFETLAVAPNPTSGELYINNIALDKLTVISLLGNIVKTINFKDGNTSNVVDLSDLTAGLYLVKLSSNGSEKTVKVLKN